MAVTMTLGNKAKERIAGALRSTLLKVIPLGAFVEVSTSNTNDSKFDATDLVQYSPEDNGRTTNLVWDTVTLTKAMTVNAPDNTPIVYACTHVLPTYYVYVGDVVGGEFEVRARMLASFGTGKIKPYPFMLNKIEITIS